MYRMTTQTTTVARLVTEHGRKVWVLRPLTTAERTRRLSGACPSSTVGADQTC